MFSTHQCLPYSVQALLLDPAHHGLSVRCEGTVDAARRQVEVICDCGDVQRLVAQVFQNMVLHLFAPGEPVGVGDASGKATQAGNNQVFDALGH